jgi:hypothetical protein
MPDELEIYYFDDISKDGTGDFDEDGATDLQEYEEETDPNPLASLSEPPFIDSISDSDPDTGNSGGGDSGGGGGCFISIVSI